MSLAEQNQTTIVATAQVPAENEMVQRERWEEIRRLHYQERRPIALIARQLDLDRKTVRRCVQEVSSQPYRRTARADTLLAGRRRWPTRRGFCTRNCVAAAAIAVATTR